MKRSGIGYFPAEIRQRQRRATSFAIILVCFVALFVFIYFDTDVTTCPRSILKGLYQTSLLQAASDSLRATELLPEYSTSWLRAGQLLNDLWKINESRQYYEKAVSLDETLEVSVGPILKGLEARKKLLDQARSNKDWPEDSIRLALDIAG